MITIAKKFGASLDNDEFEITKIILSDDCEYLIGNDVLKGPDAICDSYEQNMVEGRKKLDKLEWGQSEIEEIKDSEYYVHFTDYLTHQGVDYTHRCKQRLRIKDQKIVSIEHVDDPEEQERLNEYYKSVGIIK